MRSIHNYCYVLILLFFFIGCKNETTVRQKEDASPGKAKNVILLIGDGMGVTQVYAAMTVAADKLNIEKFKHIGFAKTYSANNYTTDSGASGTAIATGVKTNNGSIGVSPDSVPVKSVLKIAEENGYATGLVSTSAITHATPAAFIANRVSRNNYHGIALDFLNTDIDVFIGGGLDHFQKNDSVGNMLKLLEEKDYNVLFDIEDIKKLESGKLAGLTAPVHNPRYSEGRGDYLPDATRQAIKLLSDNEKGFFLMIEGSQIDWGGHGNDQDYVVEEMIDFDNAVGVALDFAKKNENTLVIVTSDHECGGMAINKGSFENREIEAAYTTGGHTGVMVPVFAYGPGASLFNGIYENTAIFDKMLQAYGF